MSKTLRFFIAGIIQGSLPSDSIHPQDYRTAISAMLRAHYPDAEIFDPVEEYPDSLSYDDAKANAAFLDLMFRASRHDVLIAFVPSASMGTAIEIWQAYNSGAVVIAVSPLEKNWVVRYCADHVLPDLAALQDFITSGRLTQAIAAKLE